MLAWCFEFAGGSAPFKAAEGSLSALRVDTANLNIWPQLWWIRCAVSKAPRFSTRRKTINNSAEVIAPIGLAPIQGNTSFSSLSNTLEECPFDQLAARLAHHSRAMASKLLLEALAASRPCGLRWDQHRLQPAVWRRLACPWRTLETHPGKHPKQAASRHRESGI